MSISNRRAVSPAPFRLFNRCLATALALVAFATLAVSPAGAQPADATGTVRGKVQNATNGAYLKNVTVTVVGTNLETFTDEFGNFELRNVPAGERTLKATYVGEPDQNALVTVAGGADVTQDFTFRKSATTRLDKDGTIVLDPFVVSTERYKNASAIAIAEQRNSVNIKNVVSTDAFGDIPNGNVGEFVKFLPGVQVDYGSFGGNNQGYADSDATGISVRGFGPEDTAVLINGLPVASATPGSLTRQVALDQLSINNASRVELIKVATPDMPANSMGGQVNLITKSAFEQPKASYSGRVYFNINSLQASLKKTVGPVNDKTYKTQPAIEASVVYPFSKTLGLSFDASATNQIDQTYASQPTYTTTGTYTNLAGVPVSLENPVLSRSKIGDISRLTKKVSSNLGLDWRPTASQLIRANVQYSSYNGIEAQRNLDFRPTVAAGADWGPTYTIGTTANSALAQTVFTRDRTGDTKSGQATYSLRKGGWKIDAAGSISVSNSEFKDEANGHYSEIDYTLNPGQVVLTGINAYGAPSKVLALWRTSASGGLAGTDKNYSSLTNWSQDGTAAKSGQAINKSTVSLYKVDVDRDLSFFRFLGANTLSLKFGARRDIEKIEKSGLGTGYQENLITGANYLNSDVLDTNYLGQSPGFGLPAQEWGSTYKLYQLNQQNTIFAAPTDGATAVSNYNSYANQQKNLTDTKDAFYAMLSGRFFHNRLSVVGGARQETSTRDGRGPVTDGNWNYAKTADGRLYKDSFYRAGVTFNGSSVVRTNADGTTTNITNFLSDSALLTRLTAAGISYPDHLYGPTNTSLESRKLQLVANRPIHGKVKGDPSFSLNFAYELTKKIDLKASVSRSFKQPSLENAASGILSGNNTFSITENTTLPADGTIGTIAVANPNLLPEQALNFDFEVAYYTDTGGRFSAGYWTKNVTNQIVNNSSYSGDPLFESVLPALGLDPAAYDNFRLNTSYNSAGTQKTDGWEFQVTQDFGFLGRVGKSFSGFLSYSFNSLGDPAPAVPYTITSPSGTPITITPVVNTIALRANKFGGAGLQYSGRKLTVQIRGVYRNANQVGSATALTGNYAGDFMRRFQPAQTNVDVSASYTLSKHYSLFLSGRDVLNGSRKEIFKDDQGFYPAYASTATYRKFGTVWTVGVSGKF